MALSSGQASVRVSQPLWLVTAAAGFDPAMTGIGGLGDIPGAMIPVGEQAADIIVECALIAFQSNDIVPALRDDGSTGRALAVTRDLAGKQPLFTGPGADQMQR